MRLTADQTERLDRFLVRALVSLTRSKIERWIEAGEVRVNERVVRKAGFRLEPGWQIELAEPPETPAHDLTPSDLPFGIAFEDEHLVVVNKPRGMATHPAPSLKEPSLVNALLGRYEQLSGMAGSFRPGIVHRLDKDTTGLLLIAKSDAVHANLSRQIAQKTAGREYLALVLGEVLRERFSIQAPLARDPRNRLRMAIDPRGRPAITHLRRLLRQEMGTLLHCQLETGRTHQIRVHLKSVGHPVVGDPLYGVKSDAPIPMQLHAWRLSFSHPVSGERLTVSVLPPDDFAVADWDAIEKFLPLIA